MATAVAWWLWDERFSGLGWVGAALIIGAVLVLVITAQKERSNT